MKMTPTQAQMLREREVIAGVTSAAVRLIGLCLRDNREDLIDQARVSLKIGIKGLETFRSIAGCDTGTEYTVLALRQIVHWLKSRDLDSAKKAFDERYQTSDAEFIVSMELAKDEVTDASS